MFIVGILSWWYGAGWREQARNLRERLAGLLDFFSIGLLLKTLFAPFRQISAGRVSGPLGVQLRAFADRLVSRLIGAMVRSAVLVVGVIAVVLYALVGGLLLVLWAVVPIVPFIGAVLMAIGWVPWQL